MPEKLSDLHPSRGLMRWAMRMPVWVYRAHLGWLLGKRFLMLTHTGRKTGLPHDTVLELVCHDPTTNEFIVASGWGEKSNWFRNIQQTPKVIVTSGNRHVEAMARRITIEEAQRALSYYARHHPRAFRKLSQFITGQRVDSGAENVRLMAESIPLVALRPERV